jgi:drug/metabolite transporter (DMT)-like permease
MAIATTSVQRGPMTLRDWGQLLLLGAIWGGSFFFARIAVAEMHPLVLVLFRVAIAAIALQLYLAIRGPSFRLAFRMPACFSCWRSPTMSCRSR